MKNLTLTPLTLILISLLSFTRPCFGSKSDSLYKVEVKGKLVIPQNEGSKMYKLELVYDNVVVESSVIVDEESFLLRVKDNTQYTLRIVKEGYVPMVISLDTRVKDNSNNYRFDNDFFLNLYGFNFSLSLDKPTEYLVTR